MLSKLQSICSGLILLGLPAAFVGCEAFEDYGPLPHLRKIVELDVREVGTLESLIIRSRVISSEASRELRLINNLQRISLEDCQLRDAEAFCSSLGDLQQLNSISFHRTQVDDKALAGLATAEKLRDVEFLDATLRGEGLGSLSHLKLRSLTLNAEDTTAEGLQCLADFQHLEELYLNVKGLEIDKLPSLRRLTRLKEISILNAMSSQEEADAFAFLAGVESVTTIRLSSYLLNDQMMASLGKLSQLENIEIFDNAVTDEGVFALESLPHLKSLRIWDAKTLSSECLQSIATHEDLESLSLCGAPIRYADTRMLECLPNLVDSSEVGMSEQEILESVAYGDTLAMNLKQERPSHNSSYLSRRVHSRPLAESSL